MMFCFAGTAVPGFEAKRGHVETHWSHCRQMMSFAFVMFTTWKAIILLAS